MPAKKVTAKKAEYPPAGFPAMLFVAAIHPDSFIDEQDSLFLGDDAFACSDTLEGLKASHQIVGPVARYTFSGKGELKVSLVIDK